MATGSTSNGSTTNRFMPNGADVAVRTASTSAATVSADL